MSIFESVFKLVVYVGKKILILQSNEALEDWQSIFKNPIKLHGSGIGVASLGNSKKYGIGSSCVPQGSQGNYC